MQFETLKEKCEYLRSLTDFKLMPNGYILVMVDGHSFSNKIKKRFKRPFDDMFINAMNETAKYICANVQGIQCAFVQSDEISFLIKDDSLQGSFFSFRISKMLSLIAGFATSKFNSVITEMMTDDMETVEEIKYYLSNVTLYEFDCKVWNVPDQNDAFAWFLYRQIDCIRNSKAQTTQTFLDHSALLGITADEQIKLLKNEKGIDWYTDFNDGEKYGRMIVKRTFNINGVERNKWTAEYSPVWLENTAETFFGYIQNK